MVVWNSAPTAWSREPASELDGCLGEAWSLASTETTAAAEGAWKSEAEATEFDFTIASSAFSSGFSFSRERMWQIKKRHGVTNESDSKGDLYTFASLSLQSQANQAQITTNGTNHCSALAPQARGGKLLELPYVGNS